MAAIFVGFTGVLAGRLEAWLRAPATDRLERPQHLDPSALSTPSLAISCAAREAMRLHITSAARRLKPFWSSRPIPP